MYEIFVNVKCVSHTPVYSYHIFWSQGGSVLAGFTVIIDIP